MANQNVMNHQRKSTSGFDYSNLADSSVVSTGSATLSRQSNSNSQEEGSVVKSKEGESSSNRKPISSLRCLDTFRGQLSSEGI